MKDPDGEIVAKARERMRELVQANTDMVDIPVTYQDEQGLLHNYLVSFKREPGGDSWKAFDIADRGSE
jgi:allophanate hydrolase subunit 1